jgi:cytochrome c oxidase subunit 3
MAENASLETDGLAVDHHFENADQQYQSAKLGMWLFLATEILFFGGLFVAYSVYRSNHPEVFIFGHHFLDKSLGALNTVILICSSLTAAWAVRAAQLKQIRVLKLMLVLTILFAFGFLGVKAVEYNSKWKHGLLWARQYNPHIDHEEPAEVLITQEDFETGTAEGVVEEATVLQEVGDGVLAETVTAVVEEAPATAPAAETDRSKIAPAAEGPAGLAAPAAEESNESVIEAEPANAQTFFSIYFLMTGLHGIHVLGGIGAFIWLYFGARRGDFSTGHFTRVDMVALYWHVVDLIWIYLFLLLYLIE